MAHHFKLDMEAQDLDQAMRCCKCDRVMGTKELCTDEVPDTHGSWGTELTKLPPDGVQIEFQCRSSSAVLYGRFNDERGDHRGFWSSGKKYTQVYRWRLVKPTKD